MSIKTDENYSLISAFPQKGKLGLHYRPFVRLLFQLSLRVTTQGQSLLTFPDNCAVHVPVIITITNYLAYNCNDHNYELKSFPKIVIITITITFSITGTI